MAYIIQRSIAGDGQTWVRSDSFPRVYTFGEAQDIVTTYPKMTYRVKYTSGVVLTPATLTRKPKPYRRHAAVTPLELRGAISMLDSALKMDPSYDTWAILKQARLNVLRELERV